jgi:hypothetical protein
MTTAVPPAHEAPRPATPPIERAPYVIAALVALVPLLVLGAAAPGGDSWRWLEVPAHMTLIAAALGIAACFARARGIALLVLFGSVACAFAWDLIHEYVGLKGLGRMDLLRDDLRLIVSNTAELLAPWLVGAIYGVLAWIAISPADRASVDRVRADGVRAALWLAGVAVIGIALTVSNTSWLTLENLSQKGTFRSSASWPDTKILSLITSTFALIAGAATALHAWRARRDRPALPTATLRR